MNGVMGKLQRATYVDLTLEQLFRDFGGSVPLKDCMQLLIEMQREELWKNEEYQVAVDKECRHGFPGMTIWHLSIKRLDKSPIHDWRDLQEIKNQICGPTCEAFELYPSEARKVDTADQYHLWAFIKDNRRKRFPQVPVGWMKRYVDSSAVINGSQRPLPPGEEVTNPYRNAPITTGSESNTKQGDDE